MLAGRNNFISHKSYRFAGHVVRRRCYAAQPMTTSRHVIDCTTNDDIPSRHVKCKNRIGLHYSMCLRDEPKLQGHNAGQ